MATNHDYKQNPCYESTRVPKDGKKRCPQCWKMRAHPSGFRGVSGRTVQVCSSCSKKKAKYLARWRAKQNSET